MKAIGDRGEAQVCQYLEAQGYRVIAQQWHCRWGEVDVIAQGHGELRFVEVKTRQPHNWDQGGLLALTPTKATKLLRAIAEFLSTHPDLANCCYQVDLALVCRTIRDHQEHYAVTQYLPNVLEGGDTFTI
ncbi:MAG: YraN family protein [Oscillatoriales cyanobacterium SM2_2_1]|nr:YraN family protein [Oscillatoriales cyanobacterium SM2_2_1]